MLKGVIFDMDGLMIDTEKLLTRFWCEAANHYGYPMTKEHVLGIRSAHTAGCKPVMIPDLSQPDEETKKLLYACCDDLSKVIGVIQKLV